MKIYAKFAFAAMVSTAIQPAVPAPVMAQSTAKKSDLAEGIEALGKFEYEQAAQILKPLADAGDAEAQYQIALLHLLGKGGLAASQELTFSYARKAEQQGHVGARLILAQAYLEGSGARQDIGKGILLTRSATTDKAATSEDIAEAHSMLALAHEEGIGVRKSPSKAAEHYKKSNDAVHDRFTLVYLVRLLDDGHGGSFEQEIDWYRKLAAFGEKNAFAKIKAHADGGDAHSQYIVGNVYFGDQTYGLRNRRNIGDVEANGQSNWEYWERAAKGGIGDAAVESTAAFQRGMPDAERLAKAAHWIKKAPTMEFLDARMLDRAHINLGNAYLKGSANLKIPRNLAKAAEHYRKAKHGDGLNEVAKAYIGGKDTEADIPMGVSLLEACAAMDNAKCQFNLGVSYVYGKGIERSYVKALDLLDRSAANGFSRGKQFADDLRSLGKLPDVTPDQLVTR